MPTTIWLSSILTCTLSVDGSGSNDELYLSRDDSGSISLDEFKSVFRANVGRDAIPFDFDWWAGALIPPPFFVDRRSVIG